MMAKALLANAPIRDINKSSFGIAIAKPATYKRDELNDKQDNDTLYLLL